MSTHDSCCTIAPYFKVKQGQSEAFRNLCQRFVEATRNEPQCLYYGFSFAGNLVHCREGYTDAAALLTHIANVGMLLEESALYADIIKVEVHGPEAELEKLREPMSTLKPHFFVLEMGFRR